MEIPTLDEEEMQMIYNWVDEIPLSRPKRNIARDFSDGVLLAEVVKHYIPHLVEIHNYSAAHSVSQKTYNWNTLNQKVFKKIGFTLTKKDIEDAVNCVPDTVERILKVVQTHVIYDADQRPQIKLYQEKKANKQNNGEGAGKSSKNQTNIGFNSNLMGGGFTPSQMLNKENQNFAVGNPFQQPYQAMGGMQQSDPRFKMMLQNQVDTEILLEKEQTIVQMKETIEILELKIKKLEQLVKLKDAKISNLTNKLQTAGIIP